MHYFLCVLALFSSLASAQTKCEANINGYKIKTIYITGDHYNAVVWAYKHLAENTCLTPVQDITKADAVLDLYDPFAGKPKGEPSQLSVTCSTSEGSSVCTDSEGNMQTTTCDVGGCSSYYGPNPAHILGQALYGMIRDASYQGEARIYTTDHKLLWRSLDQKKDHWSDLWIDKVREGTNSPGCDGRNWSVSKDSHKYKNYRRYASEKCAVEMPPLVSIDIKLQSFQAVAKAKEDQQQQMLNNAKEAAEKQSRQ